MDVSLTQSALPRVKAWAGESNAERDSCEGHCNYSLSVMAARALAAGLVKSTLMLMEGKFSTTDMIQMAGRFQYDNYNDCRAMIDRC